MTQREITGDPNATVRKHVIASFFEEYDVRMQAWPKMQKDSKAEF